MPNGFPNPDDPANDSPQGTEYPPLPPESPYTPGPTGPGSSPTFSPAGTSAGDPGYVGPGRFEFRDDQYRDPYWNQGDIWSDQWQDRLKTILIPLSEEQLTNWGRVAQEGIYGPQGLSQISSRVRGLRQSAMRQQTAAMRRRMGTRSGRRGPAQAEELTANASLGLYGREMDINTQAFIENLQSMVREGLIGRDRAIKEMYRALRGGEQEDDDGFGWGDILSGGADILRLFSGGDEDGGSNYESDYSTGAQ